MTQRYPLLAVYALLALVAIHGVCADEASHGGAAGDGDGARAPIPGIPILSADHADVVQKSVAGIFWANPLDGSRFIRLAEEGGDGGLLQWLDGASGQRVVLVSDLALARTVLESNDTSQRPPVDASMKHLYQALLAGWAEDARYGASALRERFKNRMLRDLNETVGAPIDLMQYAREITLGGLGEQLTGTISISGGMGVQLSAALRNVADVYPYDPPYTEENGCPHVAKAAADSLSESLSNIRGHLGAASNQRRAMKADMFSDAKAGFIGLVANRILVGMSMEQADTLPPLPDDDDDHPELVDPALLSNAQVEQVGADLVLNSMAPVAFVAQQALWHLARNHEVQQKVAEELRASEVRNAYGIALFWHKLPYLHQVIKESARLNAPWGAVIGRVAEVDVELGGHTIPAGTVLYVNVMHLSHSEKHWKNADKWDPERWNDYASQPTLDDDDVPDAFLAYGAGKRKCPFRKMGHDMAAATVASLLQEFNVTTAPGEDSTVLPTIVHAPWAIMSDDTSYMLGYKVNYQLFEKQRRELEEKLERKRKKDAWW